MIGKFFASITMVERWHQQVLRNHGCQKEAPSVPPVPDSDKQRPTGESAEKRPILIPTEHLDSQNSIFCPDIALS
ncbi:hypothetical protein [Kushneria aurantia]|uniref:Uncharacterized protein n=1 Tax=Kushneria aurantia TaxID=504092 RepID=A0ABV6G655_9GAMM|nr:hypothetical protein [Kushneria aurantia]